MKYVIFFVLLCVIAVLILPIVFIKWNNDGWEDIQEGLLTICGIEN